MSTSTGVINSATTTYVPHYTNTGNEEAAFLLVLFCYCIDYLGVYYAYKDSLDTGTICMHFCQNTALLSTCSVCPPCPPQ